VPQKRSDARLGKQERQARAPMVARDRRSGVAEEEHLMYTMIERRTINRERIQETVQRAQSEFFPKMQHAPGFVSFYLVTDEENGINTAISVWENKAHAEAFVPEATSWLRTLDELGHTLQSTNHGETMIEIERPT